MFHLLKHGHFIKYKVIGYDEFNYDTYDYSVCVRCKRSQNNV